MCVPVSLSCEQGLSTDCQRAPGNLRNGLAVACLRTDSSELVLSLQTSASAVHRMVLVEVDGGCGRHVVAIHVALGLSTQLTSQPPTGSLFSSATTTVSAGKFTPSPSVPPGRPSPTAAPAAGTPAPSPAPRRPDPTACTELELKACSGQPCVKRGNAYRCAGRTTTTVAPARPEVEMCTPTEAVACGTGPCSKVGGLLGCMGPDEEDDDDPGQPTTTAILPAVPPLCSPAELGACNGSPCTKVGNRWGCGKDVLTSTAAPPALEICTATEALPCGRSPSIISGEWRVCKDPGGWIPSTVPPATTSAPLAPPTEQCAEGEARTCAGDEGTDCMPLSSGPICFKKGPPVVEPVCTARESAECGTAKCTPAQAGRRQVCTELPEGPKEGPELEVCTVQERRECGTNQCVPRPFRCVDPDQPTTPACTVTEQALCGPGASCNPPSVAGGLPTCTEQPT